MINEVYRVLKDGGTYIIISNSAEDYRKNLFDKKKWEYKVMEIEKRIKVVVLDEENVWLPLSMKSLSEGFINSWYKSVNLKQIPWHIEWDCKILKHSV